MKTNNNIVTPVKVTDSATAEVSLSNANEARIKNPMLYYVLGDSEYLSKYSDSILTQLKERPVRLVSPPGSGKTELIKSIFKKLPKCVILLHQKSIQDNKLDDELMQYVIEREQAMCPTFLPPSHMICRWEVFKLVMKHTLINDYYFLCDESHNFVTEFNYRRVIIPIVKYLHQQRHVLFLTGTPLCEDCILQNPVTMHFLKNNETSYRVIPYIGHYGKEPIKGFRSQVLGAFMNFQNQYDCTIIFDNIHHNQLYMQAIDEGYYQESCPIVHYASDYRTTSAVKRINETKTAKGMRIIATKFFGEGIDLYGCSRVLIIFPIDYTYCKKLDAATTILNIIQASKRFRDAQCVDILLCQRANGTNLSNSPSLEKGFEYIRRVLNGGERNEDMDTLWKIDNLSLQNIKEIFDDENGMLRSLYKGNYDYQRKAIIISPAVLEALKSIGGHVSILPINDNKEEEDYKGIKSSYSSYEEQIVIEFINTNLDWVLRIIKNNNKEYDYAIKSIEEYLQIAIAEGSPCRAEYRSILQTICTLDEWGCLKDVVEEFDYKWRKIAKFVSGIKLQINIIKHRAVLYDSKYDMLYSEKDAKRRKEIDTFLDMLNFALEPDKNMAEMVAQYRDNHASSASSIFRKKEARRPTKDKFRLTYIPTNAMEGFATARDAIKRLGTTAKTFYKHLNEKTAYGPWLIQQARW